MLTALLAFAATRRGSDRSATAASEQTTTAPATSSQPAPAGRPNASQLQDAVADYYALLPENLEQAWQLLGPDLQKGGYGSYTKFWGKFKSVHAQVRQADPARMTVQVIVVYSTGDRRPVAELHELTMIQNADGKLLINRDKRLGPAKVPGDG